MSIETKRGYSVRQQGKEIVIVCPTEEDAKIVFNSLKLNILCNMLWKERMGKVRKFEPY